MSDYNFRLHLRMVDFEEVQIIVLSKNVLVGCIRSCTHILDPIGTSYLAQFQKRAVPNHKNYWTKNNKTLRKSTTGQ